MQGFSGRAGQALGLAVALAVGPLASQAADFSTGASCFKPTNEEDFAWRHDQEQCLRKTFGCESPAPKTLYREHNFS